MCLNLSSESCNSTKRRDFYTTATQQEAAR